MPSSFLNIRVILWSSLERDLIYRTFYHIKCGFWVCEMGFSERPSTISLRENLLVKESAMMKQAAEIFYDEDADLQKGYHVIVSY